VSSVEADLQQQQLNFETYQNQTRPYLAEASIQYSQRIIGTSAENDYNVITVGPADLSALVSKAVIESTQIQVTSVKYTS
jgi:hypothetical protein